MGFLHTQAGHHARTGLITLRKGENSMCSIVGKIQQVKHCNTPYNKLNPHNVC